MMSGDDDAERRVNYWAMFNDARNRLAGSKRDNSAMLQQQAISYVWGFLDAGGTVAELSDSWQFGNAYGLVAARYELGEVGSRPPIRDAWQSWQARQEIWGYHYGAERRLDGPDLPPSSDTTQPIVKLVGVTG